MAERSDLWWWLRGSGTRRMFARALGGGQRPNDTYLSMATKVLDAVANEVEQKPWAGASLVSIAEASAARIYRRQHDDECGCEGCTAYDAAHDEVEGPPELTPSGVGSND